jgi:putative membrane protein
MAIPANPVHLSDTATQLSVTRTGMSADRTLMSWIRTAFSMISFGFTIGKFFQYLNDQSHATRPGSGRTLASLLILLGLFSLIAGVWEYRDTMARLEHTTGTSRTHHSILVVAVLVAVLGLVAFVGMFIRLDFF